MLLHRSDLHGVHQERLDALLHGPLQRGRGVVERRPERHALLLHPAVHGEDLLVHRRARNGYPALLRRAGAGLDVPELRREVGPRRRGRGAELVYLTVLGLAKLAKIFFCKFCEFLAGSLAAVSKRIFARK